MRYCNICQRDIQGPVETGKIHSNVRKFSNEIFELWRCPECKCLHSSAEVDLAHYYRDYPFHNVGAGAPDWVMHAFYGGQLARLKDGGFQKDHAFLDYGCGGGGFLKYLKSQGYEHVYGFDEYSDEYADRSVLDRRYDCILIQDVLEHVPDPWALLETLHKLAKPGALIVIGTPNAENIDLANTEARVHALHQPYHRHIFGKTKLHALGEKMPWEFLHYYPTSYANSPLPFANSAFTLHYFKCHDNMLDMVSEPIDPKSWRLYSLTTLFLGFFGYFFAPESDVTVTYRVKG